MGNVVRLFFHSFPSPAAADYPFFIGPRLPFNQIKLSTFMRTINNCTGLHFASPSTRPCASQSSPYCQLSAQLPDGIDDPFAVGNETPPVPLMAGNGNQVGSLNQFSPAIKPIPTPTPGSMTVKLANEESCPRAFEKLQQGAAPRVESPEPSKTTPRPDQGASRLGLTRSAQQNGRQTKCAPMRQTCVNSMLVLLIT